jgi:hypothetical protein
LSSILRALKKLDEDSMPQEGGTDEQKQKIKMRRMVTRKTGYPRVTHRLRMIAWIFLPVVIAVLIFTYFITLSKKALVTKKQDDTAKKPVYTALPRQTSILKKELKKGSAGESKPPAASGTSGAMPKPSTKPGYPESQPPVQPDIHRAAESIPPSPAQKPDLQTNDRERSIKPTPPPEFVLNGILWSDNPDRRVVLINDRYLKEGEVIDGVSVVKIERKSVILQSGEEKWTLSVKK